MHAAGVLDDGLLDGLDARAARRGVLAPKVDAAWHLHELTAGLDLRAFVLFSSAAGTLRQRPGRPTTPPPTRSSTRSPRIAARQGLPAQLARLGPVDARGDGRAA